MSKTMNADIALKEVNSVFNIVDKFLADRNIMVENTELKDYLNELIRRDKAQKPRVVTDDYDEQEYFCPCCNKSFNEDIYDMCPDCGQRLNWTGIN